LEEQKQIVKILDSLKKQTQSLESKYQQELNSLEELKKSILQKAFEGEL
jgi:type I restriction enzyme S subunit